MHSHRFARAWIPYLVLAGSLLLTLAASWQVSAMAAAQDQLRFQNFVESVQNNIRSRMANYLALLRGTCGLFVASGEVSQAEFRAFVGRLNLRQYYPGIQGIGYSARVGAGGRAAFEAEMRRQGLADFQIRPDAPRDEYHAIIYLEPLDRRNQAALGYDMFTEPTRRAAMERARDQGRHAASGKVTLVQEIDEEKQAGFLIYLPVYRGGQIPETEAERRAALAGFVYAPFRADDLLRGILGGLPQDVDFEIYDGEEARAESLLHRSDGAGAAGGAPGRAGRARFTTTGRMEIGGRAWSLRFATRPEFEAASSRRLALLTLFGGAAVSLALFLVTRAQARARSVAEAAAADLAASRGALSESEERYRTITETASDAIITIDEASRVLFVNRAAEKVFGYGAGEMTGQPLTMLMPDYLRHVHEAGLKRYVETGRRHISWEGVEVPGLHKDGREIPLEVSFGEFVKGGAHYFTGVVRDITERKRAEAALREAHDELEARVEERTRELASANRELERSNRELQDFAFVASHDLQEPLRKIQAFGDLLHGQYAAALGEEGRDFLARMQNAARRMHVLINDLLAFSRVTTKAQPFAPVDLNRVAREVLEDLEARVRQTGGRVEVGPLPTVEADALQMRQLLQNLIGNALKFHRPGEPPAVAVRAEAVGDGHCRLTVEDNGIGFDEKYLDRIFTPFQRLHARGEYEGTGMGLAVCRKIVERHGGQITARSRPGAGTTFIVTLPLKHLEREKD